MSVTLVTCTLGLLFAYPGIIRTVSTAEVDDDALKVARCRAKCLTKFLAINESTTEDNCASSGNCKTCWRKCRLLYYNFFIWRKMCQSRDKCKSGCQVACHFRDKAKSVNKRRRGGRFLEAPRATSVGSQLKLSWERPYLGETRKMSKRRLVYIILSQEGKAWKNVDQTPLLSRSVEAEQLPLSPVFWLLAVDQDGLVAETKFGPIYQPHVGELQISPIKRQSNQRKDGEDDLFAGGGEEQGDGGGGGGVGGGPLENLEDSLDLDYDMTEVNQSVVVTLKLRRTSSNVRDRVVYSIDWFLESCSIYPDVEVCEEPPQHFGPKWVTLGNKQATCVLPNIRFNSKYTVYVEDGKEWKKELAIITPKCLTPVASFTRCEENKSILSTADAITWYLNNVSLTYNYTSSKVIANISWVPPFNKPNVRYSISWQGSEDRKFNKMISAGKRVTTQTHAELKFDIGFVYKIRVTAFYKTEQGINETLQSEFSYLNVTRNSYDADAEFNSIEPPADVKQNIRAGAKRVQSAAIVAAIATLVVVTGILVLLIYKKRKSLKEVVIIKTMAAKNNTYKSNVTGCKMDYTPEPPVVTDEWELDPDKLKFSTPLGQGAFGKVVTGYYDQRKVAIKVVKDSAPLSYKEDLLAELNLMKRIGCHPNIVSMVGACTQREPIALVMEYVPYGNLNNFLRKCRMEGEVRAKNGVSEINYSIMDKNGQIENGIITAIDILSFARQVSIAMEYMAENKYVHRDLAARNVLLDCGKVVKVCDFGLSRDIYKDNQYQKLTNGKLPIKWMAIESLRDRLFTTHSDVWSFGILLWEIVTMGSSPYPSIALADLYHVLCSGYRMEKTSNCSDELYQIMLLCWAEEPKMRPSFTQLRHMLEELLSRDRNYLDLDNINVPLVNSENSSPPQSFDSFADFAPPLPKHRLTEMTAEASSEEVSTECLIRQA